MPISQCNNSYVFPGLGLGVIAAGVNRVTDNLFLTAAHTLSECASSAAPMLLPPLGDIWNVSRRIALEVGAEAMRHGLAPALNPDSWEKALDGRRWTPRYLKMRYHA